MEIGTLRDMNGRSISAHPTDGRLVRGRLGRAALVGALLILCPWTASAQPTPPPSELTLPDGAPGEAIELATARLVTALAEAGGPTDNVTFDVHDLGDGLYGVRAFQMGSYPGTGSASLVVGQDGRSYGTHGDHDLAELARERDWIASPPAAELLLRLVDAAYFEGMGSTTLTEPGLQAAPTGLELHFERFVPPGPTFPWRAVFPAEGEVQLETGEAVE